MDIWWDSLATPLRVFYVIAISTTFFMLLQFAALLFGLGDGDAELDGGDADGDGGGGHVLSIRTAMAFLAGFGWTGVAALKAGWSLPLVLVASVGVGSLFMGGVLLLMRVLYSLRYSGTLDYRNAIGELGSVYLRIPAAMQGPGQVEVKIQGRLCVVQAFTKADHELGNQVRVRVTDTMDQNTLIVEPLTAQTEAAGPEGR